MLDAFEIGHARPSWPVNRWIGAMLRLYRPHIEELVKARDAALADWQAAHPDRNAFEDRELEIASCLDIAIDDDVAAVAAALERG